MDEIWDLIESVSGGMWGGGGGGSYLFMATKEGGVATNDSTAPHDTSQH